MFTPETTQLIYACGWSLASVAIGLLCGFFIGRFHTQANESNTIRQDRESTLTAMLKLMQSTNQLNLDVDEHNTALESAQSELKTLTVDVRSEKLHRALMANITRVVKSNRRLENDLIVSRFQLESQAQELDRTRHEARTDALCDIGNRKAIDERLKYLVSRFQIEKFSFGLMLIDVDHFKRVNDTFGHAAGDEVLTSIASALKQCVRPEDFVGRLGGDEFVLILEGLTETNAAQVTERIRGTIEKFDFSVDNRGQSTVVTLSMGLAVISPRDNPVSIYDRADRALYKSKQLGRNRLYTLLDDGNGSDSEPLQPRRRVEPEVSTYEAFKEDLAQESF